MEFGNKTKRSVNSFTKERKAMIERIKQETQLTASYTGRKKLNDRVIQALANVPRHYFVENSQQRLAYIDSPLPIHCGQTISQPFIVALMTDLLELSEDAVVLEIGTGSGYQAAILSTLSKAVYSIEIIDELAKSAQNKLTRYGYENVTVFVSDGYYGLPDHAPYDGIIVTAVTEEIPQPLLDQLKPGGRMVIPVGSRSGRQNLLQITKSDAGEIEQRNILPVAFVPLTRYKNKKIEPAEMNIESIDPDQEKADKIDEN